MKRYATVLKSLFIGILFTCCINDTISAQQYKTSNTGDPSTSFMPETTIGASGYTFDFTFFYSKKAIYKERKVANNGITERKLLYTPPDGVDIISVVEKSPYCGTLLAQLSNGKMVLMATKCDLPIQEFESDLNLGSQSLNIFAGDDVYVVTSTYNIYKSSNNGLNYIIDTFGLNAAHAISLCIDTFQNVYIASNSGLFSQPLTGTTWTKNTNFPGTSPSLVFADRKSRLFVATSNRFYISNNTGATFSLDTTGIGTKRVLWVSDDSLNNIYLVVNSTGGSQGKGDRIYKSAGGIAPFVRIDQPISNLNEDVSNPYIFSRTGGDSAIYANASIGLFKSLDFGTTWLPHNNGISALNMYGIVKANNGRLINTSDIGCFALNSNDSIWNKVYPPATYLGGQPVYKDNSGTLYTRGIILFSDLNSKTRLVVKSIDNGVTWVPDTLGLYQLNMFTWFVDENGVQHAAQYGNGTAPVKLFSKQPGLSWMQDAGITSSNFTQPIAFGSNKAGKIFFSMNDNTVWSKTGAANWVLDNTGNTDALYDFASKSDGTIYAGGTAGVWKQSGGTWNKLNNPPSPTGNSAAFAIAIDTHDRLWANFSYFNASFLSIGTGVFYTDNDGTTWKEPPFPLDTITFRKLVAIGDSIFGLSYSSGAYLFQIPGSNAGAPPSVDSVAITYSALSNTSGTPSSPYYTNYAVAGNTTATVYKGDQFELSLKVNNNSNPYNIGVWLDANNNKVFDSSENVLLSTRTAAVGSNWIQVPLTIKQPNARLRIRVSTDVITKYDCCKIFSNGETEDYTLTTSTVSNCRWTGRISTDFQNAGNWSCGSVPDATKSIMIPAGTPFNCEILNADATVDRVWIQPGATFAVKNNRKLNSNGSNTTLTW